MKKLMYLSLVALSVIFLIQSCVPNNPTPRSNRLIKKSTNFITQDNANGRIKFDPLFVRAIYNYNAQNKITRATVYHAPIASFQIREQYIFTYNSDYVLVDNVLYNYISGIPTGEHEYYRLYYTGNNITSIVSENNMDSTNNYNIQFAYNTAGQLSSIQSIGATFTNFVYAGNNLLSFDKSIYDLSDNSLVYTNSFNFTYSYSITDRREINYEIEKYIFTFNDINGLSLLKMTGLTIGDFSNQLITQLNVNNTLHKRDNLFIENDFAYKISYERDSLDRIVSKNYSNFIDDNEPDTSGVYDYSFYYDYY